jgi:hypothetical protein
MDKRRLFIPGWGFIIYMKISPYLWLGIILGLIVVLTSLGPQEKSLGTNVQVVYLHGAWVLTALVSMITAGITGVVGLITHRMVIHRWSQALGRTGLLFWLTYLPLSLVAMQTNWNGLFLAEPRWRVALIFGVVGLFLQIGLTLIATPAWTSAANLVYILVLMVALRQVGSIMHPPPSPIFNSGVWQIELFFIGLNLLTWLAAWQVTRLMMRIKG